MEKLQDINPEYLKEIRTPAELLELTLNDIEAGALELSQARYTTAEDANSAGEEFNYRAVTAMEEIPGIDQIIVQLSGEGVGVANSVTEPYEDGTSTGLVVKINKAQPFNSIEETGPVSGFLVGVYCPVIEGEDGFRVKGYLTFNVARPRVDSVFSHDGLGLIGASIGTMGVSSLDGRSAISIPELEMYRHIDYVNRAAQEHGLVKTGFKRHLNKLDQIFSTEQPREFTEIKKPEIIRDIGRLAAEHAHQGAERSRVVADMVLASLGHHRRVKIGFIDTHSIEGLSLDNELSGRIVDVVMPQGEEDPTEPAIVLEAPDIDKIKETAIEFDKVKSFGF